MGVRRLHVADVRALARHALAMGAAHTGAATVRWDISAKCSDPRTIIIEGRNAGDAYIGEDAWGDPAVLKSKRYTYLPGAMVHNLAAGTSRHRQTNIFVEMMVRCRRCESCLSSRRWQWTSRAMAELQASWRTWFGTITLSTEHQVKALYRAQLKAKAKSLEWHSLVRPRPGETEVEYSARNAAAQFARIHDAIQPELTKWLKRVRKESGAKLRYLLVAEAHKSGLPHYHILVHEAAQDRVVRKRTLQQQWKLGFTQFTLVSAEGTEARYVCKYLSKAAEARVRASVGYGLEDR